MITQTFKIHGDEIKDSKGNILLGTLGQVLKELGKYDRVNDTVSLLGYDIDFDVKVYLKRRRSKRIYTNSDYGKNCIYLNSALNLGHFKRELVELILKAAGHFACHKTTKVMLKGHSPRWKALVSCFGLIKPKATTNYPELALYLRYGTLPTPPPDRRAAIAATRLKINPI